MNDNFQFRPTRFSILPNVVKNLLIINGVFFLATIAMEMVWGIDLTDMLGLHYIGASDFRPFQLVTYMFMHGSFAHLFSICLLYGCSAIHLKIIGEANVSFFSILCVA